MEETKHPIMPTAEQIAELISSKMEPKAIEVSLPAELVEEMRGQLQEDAPNQDRKTLPPDPVFAEDMSSGSVAQDVWNRLFRNIGPVKVTEIERRKYWKSFLLDEPVELVMPVHMKGLGETLNISVITLTNWQYELIMTTLDKDARDGTIFDASSYASRLQYYHVSAMVTKIGTTELEHLSADVQEEMPQSEAIDLLRAIAKRGVMRWQEAKWRAVITAVRVFMAKMQLLSEGMENADFPETAPTE